MDILTILGEDMPGWKARAKCLGADPEIFFPARGESAREPKEVCRECEVREDCLEFAIVNGEKFGIWGGMSERERRRVRRARLLQAHGLGQIATQTNDQQSYDYEDS